MSPRRLQIAVPAGTAGYWLALLRRGGLPIGELDERVGPGAIVFLPDAAGSRSPALRQAVAAHRRRGGAVLAGSAWAGVLGLPAGAEGTTCTMDLPEASALLRADARMQTLRGAVDRPVREIVATVDHGRLRRDVEAALRALAFTVDLPFVSLAHAPVGHDGTLAVRIDADGYRAEATTALLDTLAQAGLRATWFIDVERHQANGGLPALATIAAAGHELQSHAFRHYTYRSTARNAANLRRAAVLLAEQGIPVTAVAAPFGTWNPGFDAALRQSRALWSSEFSRVHDDVPGPLAGGADEPWQVPVHPVCPALLFAAGASVAEVHGWFRGELMQCLQRGEPAVVYGHPIDDLGRCPELLADLHATARMHVATLWQPTLGELHTFYRARADQRCEVEVDADGVHGVVEGPAPLRIERRGRPTATVHGVFHQVVAHAAAPVVPIPARRPEPWRAEPRTGERLRTSKLRLQRLLREWRR